MDAYSLNQNIPEIQPQKRAFLNAIFLGLLTFIVTPIIALIIAVPFLLLGNISESFNPIMIVVNIFRLKELGGFFAAHYILMASFALLGDICTAVISWFIHRSKKLAAITFVSALFFQIMLAAITLPATIRKSQTIMQSGIESEQSYQEFAHISDVRFDIQEPYSDIEIGNRHPEYGHLYNKLLILVPVSVSQPGTYQVNVRYSFSKAEEAGSTSIKKARATLGIGTQTMQVEFFAHEITSYGFWSPASVNGIADIQLSYIASEKRLLDKLNSNSAIEKNILEQFLKDEGLNKQNAQVQPTVTKFIERKEVYF